MQALATPVLACMRLPERFQSESHGNGGVWKLEAGKGRAARVAARAPLRRAADKPEAAATGGSPPGSSGGSGGSGGDGDGSSGGNGSAPAALLLAGKAAESLPAGEGTLNSICRNIYGIFFQ